MIWHVSRNGKKRGRGGRELKTVLSQIQRNHEEWRKCCVKPKSLELPIDPINNIYPSIRGLFHSNSWALLYKRIITWACALRKLSHFTPFFLPYSALCFLYNPRVTLASSQHMLQLSPVLKLALINISSFFIIRSIYIKTCG